LPSPVTSPAPTKMPPVKPAYARKLRTSAPVSPSKTLTWPPGAPGPPALPLGLAHRLLHRGGAALRRRRLRRGFATTALPREYKPCRAPHVPRGISDLVIPAEWSLPSAAGPVAPHWRGTPRAGGAC